MAVLPQAHNNLANALALEGNIDRAVRHYRQALSLKPDFAAASPATREAAAAALAALCAVAWARVCDAVAASNEAWAAATDPVESANAL